MVCKCGTDWVAPNSGATVIELITAYDGWLDIVLPIGVDNRKTSLALNGLPLTLYDGDRIREAIRQVS